MGWIKISGYPEILFWKRFSHDVSNNAEKNRMRVFFFNKLTYNACLISILRRLSRAIHCRSHTFVTYSQKILVFFWTRYIMYIFNMLAYLWWGGPQKHSGYGAALQIRKSLVHPSWCQWIFHWHKILPIALWSWGQKWVPGVFPEGKGGRCVRLTTYHHAVCRCHEIWEP